MMKFRQITLSDFCRQKSFAYKVWSKIPSIISHDVVGQYSLNSDWSNFIRRRALAFLGAKSDIDNCEK